MARSLTCDRSRRAVEISLVVASRHAKRATPFAAPESPVRSPTRPVCPSLPSRWRSEERCSALPRNRSRSDGRLVARARSNRGRGAADRSLFAGCCGHCPSRRASVCRRRAAEASTRVEARARALLTAAGASIHVDALACRRPGSGRTVVRSASCASSRASPRASRATRRTRGAAVAIRPADGAMTLTCS